MIIEHFFKRPCIGNVGTWLFHLGDESTRVLTFHSLVDNVRTRWLCHHAANGLISTYTRGFRVYTPCSLSSHGENERLRPRFVADCGPFVFVLYSWPIQHRPDSELAPNVSRFQRKIPCWGLLNFPYQIFLLHNDQFMRLKIIRHVLGLNFLKECENSRA